VAETAPGNTKPVIQLHAVSLYRKVLPQLTGLTRARIEKRLAAAQLAAGDDELIATLSETVMPPENGVIIVKPGEKTATAQTFAPPVIFRIVAQTEEHNLRIGYGVKQIIFNWERSPTELRIDGGPVGHHNKPGAGAIPKNTWVTIDIMVTPRAMAISVDGQLRDEVQADFSQVNDPLQFSAYNSTLKIKSIRVRQLNP